MKFKFNKKQVKAFRHIVSAHAVGRKITLFLDNRDVSDKEINAIYDLLDSLINAADELEKKGTQC